MPTPSSATPQRPDDSAVVSRRGRARPRALLAALGFAALAAACASPTPSPPTPTPAPTAGAADSAPAGVAAPTEPPLTHLTERSPEGASPPPGFEGRAWADVLDAAYGQPVRWLVPTDDPDIGRWIDDYVYDVMLNRYGVVVERHRVAAEELPSLLASPGWSEAGYDLLWLPGRPIGPLAAEDRLYGPWTGFLPSGRFADLSDDALSRSFGEPVNGMALPWGRARLVLAAAGLDAPPEELAGLLAWAEANPGRFTYPAPPDPVGSAFVRLVCRAAASDAGHAGALDAPPTDEAAVAAVLDACMARLQALSPSLWAGGAQHPRSADALAALLEEGEVDLALHRDPAEAGRLIERGAWPAGVRGVVLADGGVAEPRFLAIPAETEQAAGALVLANFLLAPDAQDAKQVPDNWGDETVLDPERLPEPFRALYADVPRHEATVPRAALDAAAVPEVHAGWVTLIDARWAETFGGS